MKKRLFSLLFPLILLLSMTMTAFGMERRPLGEGETRPRWVEFNEDALLRKNEWFQYDDGTWIYLDNDGYTLQSTWFQDVDGKWYYFDEYCYMLHDTTTPDGYYVGSDGAWVPGETATQ